jgi:hypothetical protein
MFKTASLGTESHFEVSSLPGSCFYSSSCCRVVFPLYLAGHSNQSHFLSEALLSLLPMPFNAACAVDVPPCYCLVVRVNPAACWSW